MSEKLRGTSAPLATLSTHLSKISDRGVSVTHTYDTSTLLYQCIKILNVCLAVHNGSGKFGGRDYSRDARPSYLVRGGSESRIYSH